MPAGLTGVSNVCVIGQYKDMKISASNDETVVILHVRGKNCNDGRCANLITGDNVPMTVSSLRNITHEL
jgi:hypothetical protein